MKTRTTICQICFCLLIASACSDDKGAPKTTDTPSDAPATEKPWFVDQVNESGVDFIHQSGQSGKFYIPEIMAGGAALFDMDADGDLDLYLIQSGDVNNATIENPPNQLYKNDGTGKFTNATAGSGADNQGYGIGAATGDYDNDGDIDLYVTNVGANALLQNDGQGQFTDVTAAAGINDDDYSASASFFDADSDGDLDLYVCNYLYWSPQTELECKNSLSKPDYCAPIAYRAPASDRLYINQGNGTFIDASEPSGIAAIPGTALGVVASDFSGDGKPDLFVANDGMPDRLWINQGNNTFKDEALLSGTAMDMSGKAKAGMGVTTDDIDHDGDQDVMVCNLWRETDSLFINNGSGGFRDATTRSGLAATPKTFTRFGLGLADFDNDGTLDLYQANGRVAQLARRWGEDPYGEPNLLFKGSSNAGGIRFEEVTPRGGADDTPALTSRGAAFGDLDNDGRLDVIVVNRDAAPHVLMNIQQDTGNWAMIRAIDRHGRDAIGAQIMTKAGDKTWTQIVRTDGSYCTANDPRVHIGLGKASTIDDITITWPTGQTQTFGPQPINQMIELREDSTPDLPEK